MLADMRMQRYLHRNLLRRYSTLFDGIWLMDEFDSENGFLVGWWDSFLDAVDLLDRSSIFYHRGASRETYEA